LLFFGNGHVTKGPDVNQTGYGTKLTSNGSNACCIWSYDCPQPNWLRHAAAAHHSGKGLFTRGSPRNPFGATTWICTMKCRRQHEPTAASNKLAHAMQGCEVADAETLRPHNSPAAQTSQFLCNNTLLRLLSSVLAASKFNTQQLSSAQSCHRVTP